MNITREVNERQTHRQHMARDGEPRKLGIWECAGKMLHNAAANFQAGFIRARSAALHEYSNDSDKADIPRAGSRSQPLHRGGDRSCRTGMRAAGAEIHADPPS